MPHNATLCHTFSEHPNDPTPRSPLAPLLKRMQPSATSRIRNTGRCMMWQTNAVNRKAAAYGQAVAKTAPV